MSPGKGKRIGENIDKANPKWCPRSIIHCDAHHEVSHFNGVYTSVVFRVPNVYQRDVNTGNLPVVSSLDDTGCKFKHS